MTIIITQIETAEKAVASLELQEVEVVDNNWDFSDRDSLNSVCHLGCAGHTFPSSVVKNSHMKNDMTCTSSSTGFLEVGVDASLLGVGGQLEDLVKAAQTYGQLRFSTRLLFLFWNTRS